MQSAGKDSTGMLLAIAAAGRGGDVRAATYDAGLREQEAVPAAELSRRFGIRHRAVQADPRAELDLWLRFAERAPAICADVALFAYLRVLAHEDVDGGVVLDGLGNDAYMGYVEPRRDALLGSVALARHLPAVWGRAEPPGFGARVAYLWKTAQMYPAERCLAGSRLAPSTVRRLVPVETAFADYFARLDHAHRALSPLDFRSYVRGRIFDGAMTMPKGRLAAGSRGARAVYPYCDADLIEYCFHLPPADRYDRHRRRNKVALRRLLSSEVGDAPYLRQKGSFRFDVVRFVAANEHAIRNELAAGAPFFRELDRWADFLLRRKASYVHAYELLTLFMLASWLVRRPARVVRPLRDLEPAAPAARLTLEL
jgi:asparagine synthetase B (glutamine-hydrolysing)